MAKYIYLEKQISKDNKKCSLVNETKPRARFWSPRWCGTQCTSISTNLEFTWFIGASILLHESFSLCYSFSLRIFFPLKYQMDESIWKFRLDIECALVRNRYFHHSNINFDPFKLLANDFFMSIYQSGKVAPITIALKASAISSKQGKQILLRPIKSGISIFGGG